MKKLILTFALILTCSAYTMQAQRVSVNINIGSQPAWGPVGYDYVDYYYMPDIDCYYSVNQGLFFYMNAVRPDQDNHQVLIIPKHLPVRVIVHRITRDLLLKVSVRVLPVQTEDRIF